MTMTTRGRKRAPKFHIIQMDDGRWRLDITSVDPDGARRRRRLRFDTERAAISARARARERCEDGLTPFEEERETVTVRDVLALYHGEHIPDVRPNSQARAKEHRTELEKVLGDAEAERLSYEELLRYRRQRKDDYKRRTERALSDVTVKKELSHLRAGLRFAKVNKKIRFHVFEELTRDTRSNLFPSENEGAGQLIEDAVFEAIVSHLVPMYRPAVRFMRESGMRKGEVCGLRWSDVKADRVVLSDRPGNKTGGRAVPLTAEMKALFPPRRLDASALVFATAEGGSLYHGLGQGWDEARRKAGYPTLRLHDIRHTVATELDELGDRRALEVSLGMSGATVERYVKHHDFKRTSALFARRHESRHKPGTTPIDNAASKK